jgi:hypothetical protein
MIERFFERVNLPFPDSKIQFFSDGNDDYKYVLPNYYADTCIDYGQLVKIREKGRVVDKIKRTISGNPDLDDIETTNVENFNGILRERVGRLVRKSKCYSKKRSRLSNAVELFQFYWNFMHKLKGKMTPGMIENLSDYVWSWDDFLLFHCAV